MNYVKGTLTQPGSIGQQTISLASDFDPKLIRLYAVPVASFDTTSGTGTLHRAIGIGYGSYRGSTVQQWNIGGTPTNSDAASIQGDHHFYQTSLLGLGTSGGSALDTEIDLVSMQGGGTSQVVIDWINLDATASIIVHYEVWGGSDIDAFVGAEAVVIAATQDLDGPSGFGKPDLAFLATAGQPDNTYGTADIMICHGAVNASVEQCMTMYVSDDATAVALGFQQRSDRCLRSVNPAGIGADWEAHIDSFANWPSNGVRIAFDDQSGNSTDMIGFAFLKSTTGNAIPSKIAEASSPTSNGDQDHSLSFTPVGVCVQHGCLAASTSLITSGADLGMIGFGGCDGTNEGHVLLLDEDAELNMRVRMRSSNTKTISMYEHTQATPATSILTAADCVLQTNNLRFSWTTTNATARAYCYVAFGSPAAGAAPDPKPKQVVRSQAVMRAATR